MINPKFLFTGDCVSREGNGPVPRPAEQEGHPQNRPSAGRIVSTSLLSATLLAALAVVCRGRPPRGDNPGRHDDEWWRGHAAGWWTGKAPIGSDTNIAPACVGRS